MKQTDGAVTSNRKTWAKAIFIWVFLFFWLIGMTGGLMGRACGLDRHEGQKKLRFCNISIFFAAPFKLIPVERAKGSIIQLERGIALAQIGRGDSAVDAFVEALNDARARQGSWERELHRRMSRLEDERILNLWISAIQIAGIPKA